MTPNENATPVLTKNNLKPTIFRGIAVACMLIACILALFQPFYTVEIQSEDEEDLVDLFDAEESVSFSVFDLITDFKGEIDLYNEYKEDVAKIQKEIEEDPDNETLASDGYMMIKLLKADISAPENSGKFSAAMTTYLINLELENDPMANECRFEAYISHGLFFIIPVICLLIPIIAAIVALCQMIIALLKPAVSPKATGAGVLIMVALGHGITMFLLGYMTIGYAANYAALIPLLIFTVAGIVCEKLYCKAANITK